MLGKITPIKGNLQRRIRVLRQTQNIITVNGKFAGKTRELFPVVSGKEITLTLASIKQAGWSPSGHYKPLRLMGSF